MAKYDVEVLSYKMQYPKLLCRKEQKDYSNDMFKVENAQFQLHTVDPFNIIGIGRRIKRKKPDLILIQWWHPYFAPCYWLLAKAIGKNISKMYICHNVFPHERFPMDRFLIRLALREGDSFIVHSQSDGEDLLTIKKDAVFRLNPHPTYNVFKIRGLTQDQAREKLGRSQQEKLLLFFGFVREYKGLKHLLKAMPLVRGELGDVVLMVVGSFGNDRETYLQLIRELYIEDCVKVLDEYTPDNEVEKYFAACDMVVLPYESATQSGIVQISYGFEKPVIVTDVGGLPDVVADGRTGYVVEPGNPEALARAIADFYQNKRAEAFQKNVRKEAWRFSWERMRQTIEELM